MAYTDVTGTWTQPAATCTPGSTTSAAVWVGIGGYSQSSQKLEQTGTSADCDSSGKATYYAWYELVPADSVNIKLKIFPGRRDHLDCADHRQRRARPGEEPDAQDVLHEASDDGRRRT